MYLADKGAEHGRAYGFWYMLRSGAYILWRTDGLFHFGAHSVMHISAHLGCVPFCGHGCVRILVHYTVFRR